MCICAKELPLKDAPMLLTSVASVIVLFCRNEISSTQSESVLPFFYKMSTYVGLSETAVWVCPQYCKGIIKQDHGFYIWRIMLLLATISWRYLPYATTGVNHKFSTKTTDFITQKTIILLFCEMFIRNYFLFKSTFPPACSKSLFLLLVLPYVL